MKIMFLAILLAFSAASFGQELVCCTPAPKKPVQKVKTVIKYVPAKPVQPTQKQEQVVHVHVSSAGQQQQQGAIKNNRIGLALGVSGRECCNGGQRRLIGGIWYDRRVAGDLFLGIEVLTNQTILGRIGVEF
jgi:hypothetical protein